MRLTVLRFDLQCLPDVRDGFSPFAADQEVMAEPEVGRDVVGVEAQPEFVKLACFPPQVTKIILSQYRHVARSWCQRLEPELTHFVRGLQTEPNSFGRLT